MKPDLIKACIADAQASALETMRTLAILEAYAPKNPEPINPDLLTVDLSRRQKTFEAWWESLPKDTRDESIAVLSEPEEFPIPISHQQAKAIYESLIDFLSRK